MPLEISSHAQTESQKNISGAVWLLLVEFAYQSETPVRVCLNNESITWDGNDWSPAIFSLEGLEESKEATVPEVNFTFHDLTRKIIPIVKANGGAVGATVTIRVVLSTNLSDTTPEEIIHTKVMKTAIEEPFGITFSLGLEDLSKLRCPLNRYFKNACRYRKFKDEHCGYTGTETECNRTLSRCRELDNQARYGGFPGTGVTGYIS